MSSPDTIGPADAWWSLFSFALAPFGEHFFERTDSGVASAPGQKREVLLTASAPVSTASVASSPTLNEATTTAFGNHFARTESPHWSSQRFQVGEETQPFKLYVPNSYRGQPLPLIVMLHGAQQDPDDFALGTGMNAVAEEKGYIVVYPEQPQSVSSLRCWNWFRPENRTRDRGETSMIAALTRHVMTTYNVDGTRVYVAGMSAGGAMAVNLAVTYPDLYAGAAIHSGIAFGVADEHLSALCAMNDGKGKMQLPEPISPGQQQRAVPLIVFHGDADDTVHPRNGEQIVTMSRVLHGDFSDMHAETMCSSAGAEGHASTRYVFRNQNGASVGERWVVHGLGHAWSGGYPDGTYTDLRGPRATREIVRFFEQIRLEIRQ
ncbi:extracellular catalytic domain type 1 short-chain-length polyhydroxyalkanoate depolymerase [Caballeronia cordobensis]|uniref:extracellular catalytic domain type 1 short-chain-length polyhydroxyalkanoate depolymerase n=1 Tax=Caballeronia cordobensis TaxID=1353886 RepID=UPI0006AD81FE|nr:PHB depolymerase family esterase [Caballeronia cordobensis]